MNRKFAGRGNRTPCIRSECIEVLLNLGEPESLAAARESNVIEALLNQRWQLLNRSAGKPSPNQFDLKLIAGAEGLHNFSAA